MLERIRQRILSGGQGPRLGDFQAKPSLVLDFGGSLKVSVRGYSLECRGDSDLPGRFPLVQQERRLSGRETLDTSPRNMPDVVSDAALQ